jgi:hypothetical protein
LFQPRSCAHRIKPTHARSSTHSDNRKCSAQWAPLRRFIAGEARLSRWAARRRATVFAYEFIRFGIKQAWACLFGGAMVALLIGTYL